MGKQIARVLRWVSVAACLTVAVSFGLFAINQTSKASVHQQEEVSGQPVAAAKGAVPGSPQSAREGGVRKVIDEVAEKLTSPFSGITAGSSSEWVVRGVGLLGVLILYGFGLGYIARLIRVRV